MMPAQFDSLFTRAGNPSWWSELWETLSGWIKNINEWVGPLIDLYKELEEAGIITPAQAAQAEAEGWTKEELISLIKAQMQPAWQKYLPWIIAGGFGIALLAVLLGRKPPVYVATK